MAIALGRLVKNSQRITVPIAVQGDPGEDIDCEGVTLGKDSVTLPPTATANDIADAVRDRAAEIYAEGYASWVLHNQVAALINTPEA